MNNVMKLIKTLSDKREKVTDENAQILVTNKGAWNVITGEVGHTGPKDLITDRQQIGVLYEAPDETKILFLETNFMSKIIPDPDMRKCFMEHRSTVLIGGSSQKWIEADIGLRTYTLRE